MCTNVYRAYSCGHGEDFVYTKECSEALLTGSLCLIRGKSYLADRIKCLACCDK
jgi:hypothetical protein